MSDQNVPPVVPPFVAPGSEPAPVGPAPGAARPASLPPSPALPPPPMTAGPTLPVAAGPTPSGRPRPGRLALVGTAAVTALATSLATLGVTGALGADEAPLAGGTAGAAQGVVASATGVVDWQAVAAAVRETVVAISVTTGQGTAEGSGVVIDAEGHVLTNEHVVADAAEDGLRVTLADGRVLAATVVGTDPTTDLAVIALTDPPADLAVASLGTSASVAVGEPVMAVGNPLGLDSTVTTGIVSATDRPVTTGRGGGAPVVTNAIQIDAAVNPGNSGGPLFDSAGKVIGITSSIATTSAGAGSIGLGFAIPIDLAARVADELVATGEVSHAFLGVSLSDGTATVAGATRRGATVEEVVAGTPAEAAGLQVGDVITAIDGSPVSGATSLTGFVRALGEGDRVVLTVVRDGAEVTRKVELAAKPAEEAAQGSGGSQERQQDQQRDGDTPLPGGLPWWFDR